MKRGTETALDITKASMKSGGQWSEGEAEGIKYMLLPVWMLTTMWKGKEYIFAINGQNGEITCDSP